MKKWVLIFPAITVVQACDAPWAPSLTDGSRPLNLAELSLRGPFDVGPDIIASTSLAQVRDQVIFRAMGSRRTEDQVCQKYGPMQTRAGTSRPTSPGVSTWP